MTSCYGYYQVFDYDSFKVRRCPNREVIDFKYPKDSLMGVIVEKYPKFAQLVVKAKFDRRFSDTQGKYTVFISDYWDQFSSVELEQFDVGKAKEIVASNTVEGRIRTMDLLTSRASRLNAIDNMGYIHIWLDIRNNQLMQQNEFVGEQIDAFNGIIHPLHATAPPEKTFPVSPEY